ncbi:stress response rci [Apiospora marii]|uniref:Stress response rci n=1 Tax=Apiospora marii TaxID=335849 RepID=A0ABR1SAS9_9PEZI
MCSADCFLAVLAILFPPLAVWVKCGICSADSLINILLCMLGFIPGLIHAWYIIAKFPEESYEYQRVPQDSEGGRVTYVFVQGNGGPQQQQQQQRHPHSVQPKPQDQGVMNYGATNQSGAGAQGSSSAAAGSSSAGNAPPTYAEAVKGDNKIQTQD